MQSDPLKAVVTFDDVSKRYAIGTASPTLMRVVYRINRGLRRSQPAPSDSIFWALRNVAFSVQPGEVLGLIGPNGAGKTTVLKLLAQVTRPTEGQVEIKGRLSALIELGAGFHPELTGRENIYLNGAILGLRRRQIDRVLDEIIEFAELRQFIDTPVKRYSSGMYARLGFSVAVFVDPDILLVDEVLSVGDIAFQQKSLQRMLDFKAQAKAMVFVSHNLIAVQQLCSRVLWLDHGHIMAQGRPNEVIEQYRHTSAERMLDAARPKHGSVEDGDQHVARITGVTLFGSQQEPRSMYRVGELLRVEVCVDFRQPLTEFICGIALYRHDGAKLGEASNLVDSVPLSAIPGKGRIMFELPVLALVPGTYYLNVAVSDGYLITYHHMPYAAQFSVSGTEQQNQAPGPLYLTGSWHQTRD